MRITLDTNQLVRALMRPPQLATFVMAWESQRFVVVCSFPLLEEYERVLAYPEVARLIFPELLGAFRSHLIYDMEIVDPITVQPVCRDPDDDKVIATAIAGDVDYLVTEDNDLLTHEVRSSLSNQGIQVISVKEFIEQLG